MKRRAFLQLCAAAGVAAVLPIPVSALRDEYAEFLERVRLRVEEILQREGRGINHGGRTPGLWIDPPRAEGNVYVRKVHLKLVAGGSLLQKIYYEWDEVSGSRWSGT